jgi:hypothetical protein
MSAAKHTPAVDHPLFDTVLTLDERSFVVVFRVGRYIRPDAEAEAARRRVLDLLNQPEVAADIERCRKWHGNLVFYPMQGYDDNPPVTDAEREAMVAAACAAYPGHALHGSWDNMQSGISGFSVRLAKATGSAAR